MPKSQILVTSSSADYELLDSGEGEKLERFGKFTLSRPRSPISLAEDLPQSEWKKADGTFGKESWSLSKKAQDRWAVDFAGLKFWIKPTAFKHVGIFPEQSPNWEWMAENIKKQIANSKNESRENVEILNLFGYTGGATLACAQAGAKVVHIDGSKAAVTWARANAELSGLKDKPVRWIVEDARAFVEREIRRGRQYDGIIMDPPSFGHGPESELWKIEEHFLPLVESCKKLLKPKPLFFLINGYSSGYSAIAYENNLLSLKEKFGGKIEMGELAIEEGKRLLPCGIFARWSAE